MPVFLQGRRAFLSSLRRRHRRCNPLSVHRVSDSGLAYPRRAYSCFTYSCRACPAAAAACHSYSHLASPAAAACHSYPHLAFPAAAAACHSYPHFAYFAVAAFGYRGTARTAPLPLGLKCRHGPRPFYSSARSTDTARAPSAVLRDVAQPIPVPALPGAQKRRTEPHRGPSAAKKQPICRGSITAAGHLALRKIAFSESRYPDTWEYQVITSSEEDSFSI